MTCPYISTSDEGTSYCKLAEDSVKALQEKVKKYEMALTFYADQRCWNPTWGDNRTTFKNLSIGEAQADAGKIAREALKG